MTPEESAIAAFLGTSSVTAEQTGTDSYPAGDLTQWTVDERYTAWLARDTADRPVVVRAGPLWPSPTSFRASSASPALSEEEATRVALGIAKDNFPAFAGGYHRPIQRKLVEPADGGNSSWAFAWEFVAFADEGQGDAVEAYLPKWVTVWVDATKGELVAYDSLNDAGVDTSTLKAKLTSKQAAEKASETPGWPGAGLPREALSATLKLSPQFNGADWDKDTRLVWQVRADAGTGAIFIRDDDGEPIDPAKYLYLPSLTELPSFDSERSSGASR